jgi:drug/metabolite transporter (DMT)-like permease
MKAVDNAIAAAPVTQPRPAIDTPAVSGFVLGLLGVVGFSFTLPATRLALRGFDPLVVALGRGAIAAALAAIFLRATRAPLPTREQWRPIAFVAFGGILAYPVLTSVALHHRTAAQASVITAVQPATTAVMAVLRAGERPSPRFWAASGAGLVATLTFVFVSGAGTPQLPDVEVLGAVLLVAFGYAEGAVVARTLGGSRTLCWALVLSAPLSVPITAIRLAQTGAHLHADALFGLAYVSCISVFLAFMAWYAGLARGGVARVGQVQLAQVPMALLWASLLLGEHVGIGSAIAAVFVIGCVAATQRAR